MILLTFDNNFAVQVNAQIRIRINNSYLDGSGSATLLLFPSPCQYGIRLLRLEGTLLENLTDSLSLTTLYTSHRALQIQ